MSINLSNITAGAVLLFVVGLGFGCSTTSRDHHSAPQLQDHTQDLEEARNLLNDLELLGEDRVAEFQKVEAVKRIARTRSRCAVVPLISLCKKNRNANTLFCEAIIALGVIGDRRALPALAQFHDQYVGIVAGGALDAIFVQAIERCQADID